MNRLSSKSFAALAAAVCTLAAASAEAADAAKPLGWTEGAEMVSPVAVENGRIDALGGVVYSQIRSVRRVRGLEMTLLVPRNIAKKPAVVYFPGGGFTSADYEKFIEMRYALARAGFVVAAAEYRVVPDKFPAIVEDGKSAVRYLRAHADEYGIDPERIGVLGDSAGGYMVEFLGATNGEKTWDKGDNLSTSSDVQAVVSMYGISDLLSIGEGFGPELQKPHESPAVTEALLVNGPAFGKFPGKTIQDAVEAARTASPISHVDGSEPPFLLLHGTADQSVSPMQSAKFFEALKAKGVDARYKLVEGADHGGLVWFQQPVIDTVVNFFVEKLGAPERAPETAPKAEKAVPAGNL